MAEVRNTNRRVADDASAALNRIGDEDARLMQRINAAATELHQLWSADWSTDADQLERRRSVAVLQAEIDGLYERRRQLVAQHSLLRESITSGRRNIRWTDVLAA